jgi:hypothetical protein
MDSHRTSTSTGGQSKRMCTFLDLVAFVKFLQTPVNGTQPGPCKAVQRDMGADSTEFACRTQALHSVALLDPGFSSSD